jgi:hypothetical protein
MLTVIVLLLFAAVIVFDFVPQAKQGAAKKDKAVYLAIIAVSFIVLLLYSFNITVPSPTGPIQSIVKSLFNVK